MNKIKCSINGCRNVMDVKSGEVRGVKFYKKLRDKDNNVFYEKEGHRFVCIYHDYLLRKKKIRPTLDWVYGRKQTQQDNQ